MDFPLPEMEKIMCGMFVETRSSGLDLFWLTFSYCIENIKSVMATLLFRKEAKIENITLKIVDIKYFKTLWTGLRSEPWSIPTFI